MEVDDRGPRKALRKTWILAILAALLALHRPLPEKLADVDLNDKIWVHLIEPFMRVVYRYPTYLCPNLRCELWWIKNSLEALGVIFGPHWDDPMLNITTTHWNGVKVRLYQMRYKDDELSDGAVIAIHGGGFMLGNIDMYEGVARNLARKGQVRLAVAIEYRLAPYAVFPAAVDDVQNVVDYLFENGQKEFGINPRKIVIGGDSAGGNLVAVMVHRRDVQKKQPPFYGQALIYPFLQASDLQTYSYRYHAHHLRQLALQEDFSNDRTVSTFLPYLFGVDMDAHPEFAEAMATNGHVSPAAAKLRDEVYDLSLIPEEMRLDYSEYPREATKPNQELMDIMEPYLMNPEFAPMMRRNLSGLPPTLVVTVQFDILRDEGIVYAKRLEKAGVPTKWLHIETGFHGGLNFYAFFNAAQSAIDECSEWIREHMAKDI